MHAHDIGTSLQVIPSTETHKTLPLEFGVLVLTGQDAEEQVPSMTEQAAV